MSTLSAILLGLALFVGAIAPLALAYRNPRVRLLAALFYGFLMLGLTLYHTGIRFEPGYQRSPAPTAAGFTNALAPDELTQRCTEALEAAENASLIRNRSNPERLVVDRALWRQMPDSVKQAIVMCLENSRPPGGSESEIEIIEQ
jgi:disulfide bond formation protein DsbB